jgi:tripartite-type tricarboxylate transporter receptor subunit TctC
MHKSAFLAWAERREGRFELAEGRVVMMTGGSRRHAIIMRRLANALERRPDAAVNKTLNTEKVREALARMGVDVGGGTSEEFGLRVRAETVFWTKVIKDAGIKINP